MHVCSNQRKMRSIYIKTRSLTFPKHSREVMRHTIYTLHQSVQIKTVSCSSDKIRETQIYEGQCGSIINEGGVIFITSEIINQRTEEKIGGDFPVNLIRLDDRAFHAVALN